MKKKPLFSIKKKPDRHTHMYTRTRTHKEHQRGGGTHFLLLNLQFLGI